MSALDIIIGVIVLLGFYGGFKKGLFVALTSLIGLIAGVYGAIHFSDYAASYISNLFNWGEQITNLAAFAVTFSGIVFIISIAGKFLTKIADFAMLGIINKLLGGVFSGLMYAFILSVIFMFLESSSSLSGYVISEEKKESSILYTPVSVLAPSVLPQILKEVESFKNKNIENEEELE